MGCNIWAKVQWHDLFTRRNATLNAAAALSVAFRLVKRSCHWTFAHIFIRSRSTYVKPRGKWSPVHPAHVAGQHFVIHLSVLAQSWEGKVLSISKHVSYAFVRYLIFYITFCFITLTINYRDLVPLCFVIVSDNSLYRPKLIYNVRAHTFNA